MQKFLKLFIASKLILFSVLCLATSNNPDSLLSSLEMQNDTARINTILDLVNYYKDVQTDEALTFGLQALKESQEIKWGYGTAISHFVTARIYTKRKEYPDAQSHFFEALKYFENAAFPTLLYKTYNGIGVLFIEIGEFDKGLKYYQLAKEVCGDNDLEVQYGDLCSNIGLALTYKGEDEKAIAVFKEGLSIYNAFNVEPQKQANLLLNMGGAYSYLEQTDSAFYYTNKAIKQFKEVNDSMSIGKCLVNLGWFYESNEEYKLGIEKYNGSLKYSIPQNSTEDIRLAYMSLMLCYGQIGQTDSMNTHFENYYESNELFIDEISDKAIQEFEVKYETEKKEQALITAEHENDKIGLENELKQNTIYILIGVILIITLIVVIFYILNQQKQKVAQMKVEAKNNEIESLIKNQELKTYSAQMEGQAKERRRVADDLHDRVGGLLATINLQVDSMDVFDKNQLTSIHNLVQESIKEVRSISHNLADGRVDQMGLRQAIVNLKDSLLDSGKVQFDLYLENYPQDWDVEKERELYKIILELLSNTLKHAEAKHIVLQANMIDKMLNITFEDNGKGFDSQKVKHGLGMKTIAKRVDNLNGTWYIDSKIGHGSTTVIDIPL